VSIGNLNQASVIAIVGPEDSSTVLGNRELLASPGVPVMTTALDDTIITADTSGNLLRIRARAFLQGRALADYLRNELSAATVAVVQLDIESTVEVVGFTQAAQQVGLPINGEYIRSDQLAIEGIVTQIQQQQPQFVVTYGPPELAAQLYSGLRQADWPGRFVYNRAGNGEFRDGVQENLLEGILGANTWSYTYGDVRSQTFVLAYIEAFGEVPSAIAAAAYDGVYALRAAIGQPGGLRNNLLALSDFEGVQGVLSPASLNPPGEMSSYVAITELGEFGAPAAVARYSGSERIPLSEPEVGALPSPTPLPTATLEGVFLQIERAVQNVRTGPGLDYDILGQLQEGETARVIGATVDFEWVAIQFRGTTGWLFQDILEVVGDTTTVPVLTPPPTPTPPPPTPTNTPEPFPDLVVLSASPPRLTIGQPFSVTAVVRNQGSVNAGPFAVAGSFQPGAIYTAVNLGGLAAGTQTTITLSGTLATGPTGPKDVGIVADLNNQVNEGPGGETNNTLSYIYTADAPLYTAAPATGTLTLNDFQTVSLDAGSDEIQWSAGGIVPMATTQLARLTGFSSFENTHRDAVLAAPLSNTAVTPISAGDLIGFVADGSGAPGVIEVLSATSGGQITFRFRVYQP
jgi:ABC-type branched-subunit amino acid transport system substrate-binding protein/uncharacterized protein YgiM (DUF1202 family)